MSEANADTVFSLVPFWPTDNCKIKRESHQQQRKKKGEERTKKAETKIASMKKDRTEHKPYPLASVNTMILCYVNLGSSAKYRTF